MGRDTGLFSQFFLGQTASFAVFPQVLGKNFPDTYHLFSGSYLWGNDIVLSSLFLLSIITNNDLTYHFLVGKMEKSADFTETGDPVRMGGKQRGVESTRRRVTYGY
ncbi:MAG: hypothetical protein LBR93_04845 [Treponema sp.]|jgi:hypothetical protein|nr:hypothetical protein [Treponema sp.]